MVPNTSPGAGEVHESDLPLLASPGLLDLQFKAQEKGVMPQLCSVSGLGLIRPLSEEEFEWKPRFLAIEGNGILLWYIDEMSVKPEGAAAIVGPPELTSSVLTGGERVLRLNHAKDQAGSLVQLEIAIPAAEVEIWQKTIGRHMKVSLDFDTVGVISSERHLDEEVASLMWDDEESEMTVQVFINDREYGLLISPKDMDLNLRAVEFVEENHLNPAIAPKVETELLRAQTKLFMEREQHFRKHLNKTQRKLYSTVTAEAYASLAESCAASLSTTMRKMKEVIVPELQKKIDDLKTSSKKWEADYKEAKAQHEEERTEWELGNILHVQDKEALERDVKKAQYDAELFKKERDRYHKTIMSKSNMDDDMIDDTYTPYKSKKPVEEKQFFDEFDSPSSPSHPFSDEQLQADIVALRKDKRELTALLKSAQNKAKVLQYELSDAYGQKANQRKYGSSDGLTMPDENLDEVKLKYFKIREQCVLQKQQVGSAEVRIKLLEENEAKLKAKSDKLESARKSLTDEHQFDKEQLQTLRNSAAITNTSNLLNENRSLRNQLIKFRGESVRLQLRVDELLSNMRSALEDMHRGGGGGNFNIAATMEAVASSQISGESAMPPAPPHKNVDMSPIRPQQQTPQTSRSMDESKDYNDRYPSSPPSSSSHGRNNPAHKLPYTEDPTPHSASSQLSPLVEDRIMKLIFHRYLPMEIPSQSHSAFDRSAPAMTMQRFLRFAKDFNAVLMGNRGADNYCPPPHLNPGQIEIIFVNAARSNTHGKYEEAQNKKKPFAYRGGGGTDNMYTKDYKLSQSTGLTLTFPQFTSALTELACMLYGEIVVRETGAELECLPKTQKKKATLALFDVMFKKKLLPVCGKLSLIPWSLIHVNQATATLEDNAHVRHYITDNIVSRALPWYRFYCDSRGVSYKRVSKFCHDFGMIPYVINEPQLYSMYQEILLWVRHREAAIEASTPDGVEDADPHFGCSVLSPRGYATLDRNRFVLSYLVLPEPVHSGDKMSFRDFLMLFASISMLAFNDIEPESRVGKLFDLAKGSGGPALIAKAGN